MAIKNNKKRVGRKPFEYGKLLTTIIIAFFLFNFEAIVITSFVLMFVYGDLTPLNEMLIGTFAVVGSVVSAVVAFYQWKSKSENIIKIKKALGIPVKDKDINPDIIVDEDEPVG